VATQDNTQTVAVLGAGSWGTALAIQFARAGHPTRLWSRNASDAAAMRAERQNRRYLPDAQFPERLEIHDALAADGHAIVSGPIDGPFGRTFTFADPDGYHVTLHDRA